MTKIYVYDDLAEACDLLDAISIGWNLDEAGRIMVDDSDLDDATIMLDNYNIAYDLI